MIAGLKLEIAMLKRDKYGRSAERTARLLDQLELQLEELETAAAGDAIRAAQAAEKATKVRAFDRRSPSARRSPTICRESGWWSRLRQPAPAADQPGSRRWATISPRRWKWRRGSGR